MNTHVKNIENNAQSCMNASSPTKKTSADIRLLTQEDRGIVSAFFASLHGESRFYFNCNGFNEKHAHNALDGKTKSNDLFGAFVDGAMAGYLFFWDMDSLPSLGICIANDYQGMGLGTQLMTYAESYAREKKKNGIMLTVHPANVRAQSLYRKMKYQYLGTDRNGEFIFLRKLTYR